MTPRATCGTDRGYQLHRAAGEQACAPCREAHADRCAQYRATGANSRTCDCGRRITRRATACRECRQAAQRTPDHGEPEIRWTRDSGGIWRGEVINDPDLDTTRNGSWRVT